MNLHLLNTSILTRVTIMKYNTKTCMQINHTSKTFTRFAIQNDRNNGEKSAYLIVKLLLFQCQTKVYGVKRSSSAWSLTFS